MFWVRRRCSNSSFLWFNPFILYCRMLKLGFGVVHWSEFRGGGGFGIAVLVLFGVLLVVFVVGLFVV